MPTNTLLFQRETTAALRIKTEKEKEKKSVVSEQDKGGISNARKSSKIHPAISPSFFACILTSRGFAESLMPHLLAERFQFSVSSFPTSA